MSDFNSAHTGAQLDAAIAAALSIRISLQSVCANYELSAEGYGILPEMPQLGEFYAFTLARDNVPITMVGTVTDVDDIANATGLGGLLIPIDVNIGALLYFPDTTGVEDPLLAGVNVIYIPGDLELPLSMVLTLEKITYTPEVAS